MEIFIKHKELLLTRYEYSRGDVPTEKTIRDRQKLINKNEAKIITDEKDFSKIHLHQL